MTTEAQKDILRAAEEIKATNSLKEIDDKTLKIFNFRKDINPFYESQYDDAIIERERLRISSKTHTNISGVEDDNALLDSVVLPDGPYLPFTARIFMELKVQTDAGKTPADYDSATAATHIALQNDAIQAFLNHIDLNLDGTKIYGSTNGNTEFMYSLTKNYTRNEQSNKSFGALSGFYKDTAYDDQTTAAYEARAELVRAGGTAGNDAKSFMVYGELNIPFFEQTKKVCYFKNLTLTFYRRGHTEALELGTGASAEVYCQKLYLEIDKVKLNPKYEKIMNVFIKDNKPQIFKYKDYYALGRKDPGNSTIIDIGLKTPGVNAQIKRVFVGAQRKTAKNKRTFTPFTKADGTKLDTKIYITDNETNQYPSNEYETKMSAPAERKYLPAYFSLLNSMGENEEGSGAVLDTSTFENVFHLYTFDFRKSVLGAQEPPENKEYNLHIELSAACDNFIYVMFECDTQIEYKILNKEVKRISSLY